MAKLKVEIKSKDMIKPSSQTPDRLKTLQLSMADHSAPPVYMPLIFFYETPFSHENTILLKSSLSNTLVQFYPLAGRIQGNSSINCNDEGVEFYIADVFATLAEVTANPDPQELTKLLPYDATVSINSTNAMVMGVQVNRFSCGRTAISLCISLNIADAAASIAFIDAWARNARGVSNTDHHHTKLAKFDIDAVSLFSVMDLNGIYASEGRVCDDDRIVTRRIRFEKEKLDVLAKEWGDGGPQEVVNAFLRKKFIKIASCVETETECFDAVDELRAAVKDIEASYLREVETGKCRLQDLHRAYGLSSCIRFSLYEVDFGWGKPVWVSMTALPFKNTVFLLSTKCGQGIEAWVNVHRNDVYMLQEDHDFRSLASHRLSAKL